MRTSPAHQRQHIARLFHRIRILRGHSFWDAHAQGVMAALSGEERRSPFPFHIVPDNDWKRGYDRGVAAINRMFPTTPKDVEPDLCDDDRVSLAYEEDTSDPMKLGGI